MEDIEESRQILDRHNWDLLAAINNHMGFDIGSQNIPQRDVPPTVDANHVNHPAPPQPSSSRDLRGNRNNRAVARPTGRPGGNGGLFSWIWQLITRPFDFMFRYFWEFIGVGLRFLRADPRMGKTIS